MRHTALLLLSLPTFPDVETTSTELFDSAYPTLSTASIRLHGSPLLFFFVFVFVEVLTLDSCVTLDFQLLRNPTLISITSN
ncbi:hypothetical protein B0H34DRAFT_714808 [Crassisporium funariophilum]|nr:hypothetical protein B0H34DRAFT_714808 [Crassisporium funariophilum]